MATLASLLGVLTGAVTANLIQIQRHHNPDWAILDLTYECLFGALFAFGGYRLGRWVSAIQSGEERKPSGGEWLPAIGATLMRIGAAVVGVRLGFEAGLWTALIWIHVRSGGLFAADSYLTLVNVWIVAGALWSGALGLIGLTLGKRIPAAASFLGAYLALDAVRPVGSRVIDLYWGTYTSSDQVSLVAWIAHLISIGILVPCFAAVGYWSARSVTVACTPRRTTRRRGR
jgi:hypothetical protein